jgi:glycosyltransferase involved in cell wall biosynthesis
MATCVVVLDEPSRVAIDEYCPGISIEKIPNFIDPDEFEMQSCGDTECETDVAFVGWVIRNKGILELIAACAELDGCKLTLVGPVAGEIQNALDRLVPRGNTKVEIMGELSTPEVYKVLSRSKLVALPSYTEGFPLIVVEAMCMGKAIIATPVGAIPEMLQFRHENPCGECVKPRDVQGLKAAIADLLEDQLKRRLLGENARKRALSSYTVKAVVPRIIDLWRTLSERGPCV